MNSEQNPELVEIHQELRRLSNQSERILIALVGKPLDQNHPPGVISTVRTHNEVLYGTKEPPQKGLVEMVGIIWEDRIKFIALCGAVSFIAGIAGWLVPMLMKLH